MSNKPIVLIDTDSVLVEHNFEHLERLNKRFGTSYQHEDIVDFTYNFLPQEQREFMWAEWQNPTEYDNDSLTDEQLVVLGELRGFCRLVACSSPMVDHIESKYRFLLRYFDRHDIILGSSKWMIDAEVLVDDAPHNIEEFRAVGGRPIIFNKPWNQACDGPRAFDFTDITPLVYSQLLELGYDII